ncbi:NAD(P)-dependent oxidoreductase [Halomonas denitrificans]|uniref:NAD(P)-dependent oxidoreductase n=1 Tax=Halomonas denitrificans TaxID=370769 RepID=UPI001CD5965B|nr:NAD(P)-dependent oxidoreductase [Halomonas denitrificans]MCA0976551.1 NAD(P)-dependent oxidoreductase [Halomonas denitrificans]
MTSSATIALLGTGIMGLPMGRHLIRAGYDLRAWNRSIDKAAPLGELGATLVETPAEAVQGAQAVVMMVSSGPVCETLLFGDEGIARQLAHGSLIIVMSTIARSEAVALAERCRELGLGWVDAPVSGGERGAQEGSLSIMAGALDADYERAKPILQAMGHPLHIGPVGSGALAKLVNQLTVASTIAAVSEALVLAEAGGADPAKVRQAMLGGFAYSRILDQHGQRMLDGDFAPGGPAKHQLKDTHAACDVARELGLDLPLLALTDRLFNDLVDAGGADLDHSALLLEIKRRNGMDAGELER